MLIQHVDLESKVDVGSEEGDTLASNADERDGEIAVDLEEPVVEHAILLDEGLVRHKDQAKEETDGKGGRSVRVGPWVRVLGPRKAHAEQDQADRQQDVADPVEAGDLLLEGEGCFKRARERTVGKRADDGRGRENGSGDVVVVAPAIGVVVPVQGTANDQTGNETDTVGNHDGTLGPSTQAARQDLGRNGMKERLSAKSQTDNGETGNNHGHAGSPRDDEAANGTEGREHDQEPLAAPVVSGLGDDGPEDDRENRDGSGQPCDLICPTKVSSDDLTLLFFVPWSALS